jgi:hypothetical protein
MRTWADMLEEQFLISHPLPELETLLEKSDLVLVDLTSPKKSIQIY